LIVIIDNYDSFAYNLYQRFGVIEPCIEVYRNDAISVVGIEKAKPDYLIISPGPCTPSEAGVSVDAVIYFQDKLPMLGVCLGHQAIAQAFGARILRAKQAYHGKTSLIYHDSKTIYRGLPNPFVAARYHSLVVDRKTIPDCLEITAWTDDGVVMGLRHKTFSIEGVQFHPESYLTENWQKILYNFLNLHPTIKYKE
jgi:anthranilate synthase/aminodeoxychorismate synthase-like glutamine amidotransferase